MSTQHLGSFPAAPAPSTDEGALDRRLLLGAAGLAGIAAISSLTSRASAGPLTPPAGPILSTGKTLTEVEPRTALTPELAVGGVYSLQNAGSYYLTGDIVVPPNSVGVFLWAPSTLDLNGFTIRGTNGTGTAIRMTSGCTVRNGRIRDLQSGVSIYFTNDADTLVEDMFISNCSFRGIWGSIRAVVRRCVVIGPGPVGIECNNDYGLVEDCTVSGVGGWGVYINSYSTLRRCKLVGCGGVGGGGAYIGYGSRAEGCTFEACAGTGLQATARSSIDGCVAIGTSGAGVGFDLADGAEIARSVSVQNVIGVRGSTGGRIVDTNVDGCTSSGVRLTGAGNVVESCRLTRNAIAVDMLGTGGNYVHKCVMLGNPNPISVNIGGNWYPNVALASVNTATNPLASVIG